MNFELLKRTFPTSQIDRYCDGYKIIIENSTEEERKSWGICDDDIQKIINVGEKYMYQVGKEKGKFKTLTLSFKNFEIIRKFLKKLDDE